MPGNRLATSLFLLGCAGCSTGLGEDRSRSPLAEYVEGTSLEDLRVALGLSIWSFRWQVPPDSREAVATLELRGESGNRSLLQVEVDHAHLPPDGVVNVTVGAYLVGTLCGKPGDDVKYFLKAGPLSRFQILKDPFAGKQATQITPPELVGDYFPLICGGSGTVEISNGFAKELNLALGLKLRR